MTDSTDESRFLGRRLNRRTLMRGSLIGGAGLAAAALIGCGGSSSEEEDSAAALAALRASREAASGTTSDEAAAATDQHATTGEAAAATDAHAPAVADAHDAPHWTYAGAGGPEEWGSIDPDFAVCSVGRNQSPINVSTTTGVTGGDVSFSYLRSSLTVVNNGHTIQANVPPGNAMSVDGNAFGLLQFHFHSPSEHTLGGRYFPLEMHLVHRDTQGNLGVVGVFFEEGAPSVELEPIFSVMPESTTEQSIVEGFQVASLLPPVHQMFRYSGSLTTPPCSEGVRWMLMQTPRSVSTEQVAAFSALVGPNNRPLQPLWAREVLQEGSQTIAGIR